MNKELEGKHEFVRYFQMLDVNMNLTLEIGT